jgi:2-dehydropantoate 2-reductase
VRIGIIGLGAIGGVTAQRLLAAGSNVALAAGRHAAIMREKFPDARIGETLPPDPDGLYDLILLCVRTLDTERALAPAAPLLAPDGAVVCLQNGLPEERAARIVGMGRVLGTVIGWSATMVAPGEYVITGNGSFTLGGASPRLEHARFVLSQAFPVRITHNLAGARWSKLAISCAMSTLGAVSGLSLGELASRRHTREVALRIMEEVVKAAHERHVTLEPVAGVSPDRLVKLPRPLAHLFIWLAARRRPGQKSGMIALLKAGRPAGVEDLNALVDGPLNRKLVDQVHEIERGTRPISPENLDELD